MRCHSGRLWYDTPDNAIGYAMHRSRSQDAVIRVYDDAGTVTVIDIPSLTVLQEIPDVGSGCTPQSDIFSPTHFFAMPAAFFFWKR